MNLRENSAIHRILPKTMARQDNGKARQHQDNGKSRQRQVNNKTRPWKDKTTARHLESPDAMSKRSCQCKFFDVIQSKFLFAELC